MINAKSAWEKVITHCRWLGIPISHTSKKSAKYFFAFNSPVALKASVVNLYGWDENFKGAFKINLYFDKNEDPKWENVAALLHEMGHVADFRENMFLLNRKLGEDEKAAHKQALKMAEVLEIPRNKILSHLEKFVNNYKKAMKNFNSQLEKSVKQ